MKKASSVEFQNTVSQDVRDLNYPEWWVRGLSPHLLWRSAPEQKQFILLAMKMKYIERWKYKRYFPSSVWFIKEITFLKFSYAPSASITATTTCFIELWAALPSFLLFRQCSTGTSLTLASSSKILRTHSIASLASLSGARSRSLTSPAFTQFVAWRKMKFPQILRRDYTGTEQWRLWWYAIWVTTISLCHGGNKVECISIGVWPVSFP